jgi:pyruvate/2-oxoglutarate dehydrogenase complex dihydrolipoamide acyltransferase (E2) component
MTAKTGDGVVAVHLPQTGTESSATFLEWMVKVGDWVSLGDKMASAETEKSVVEIEAPTSGQVTALLVQSQEEITTETAIALIAAHSAVDLTTDPLAPSASVQEDTAGERSADMQHLDVAVEDIRRPLASPMRRAAENLLWVTQNTARASTSVEVDFEAVATMKSTVSGDLLERHGIRLTYLPIIAFAVLRSLREFPQIAARIDLDASALNIPKHVHLGIAVAREAGLIVPVIRNADKLRFVSLARQIDGAVERVRAGVHGASEVSGGTFTISNPGVFGSYLSSPIMNKGETSILCVDGVERRAVVVGSDIVARLRAFFTLAFDHRVVDGLLALRLLTAIKAKLEACEASWILEDQAVDERIGSVT